MARRQKLNHSMTEPSEIRLWSKKILDILTLSEPQDSIFGITGDMDNLGIYVSRHGRPMAENLVDVYNHLVGSFLYDLAKKYKIPIVVLPSGEELFVLGLCKNVSPEPILSKVRSGEINDFIKVHSPIFAPEVSISFGAKVFDPREAEPKIKTFLDGVGARDLQRGSLAYLEMMNFFRNELALELDRAKFASLRVPHLAVLFRNAVYVHLRDYKRTTQIALIELAELVHKDPALKKRLEKMALNHRYGLEDKDVPILNDLFGRVR